MSMMRWLKVVERQDCTIFYYESFKCKTRVYVPSLKSVTPSFAWREELICSDMYQKPHEMVAPPVHSDRWGPTAIFLVPIPIPPLFNMTPACEKHFCWKRVGSISDQSGAEERESCEKWDTCHLVSLTSVRFSESQGPWAHKILEIDRNLENSLAVL